MTCEDKLQIFCGNLRYLRKKHSLSKAKMAKILGVGVGTITKLEAGIVPRRLSAMILYNIGEYFDIWIDTLLRPLEETEDNPAR